MKKFLLPLAGCFFLVLAACNKNNGVQISAIAGKWQQTKLNLHQTDAQAVHDTTFTSTNFSDQDFYQFNGDKTAVISKSGNFSFSGKSIVIPAIELSDWVTHYTYNIDDTVLNLKPTEQVNPEDISLEKQTIILLDNNHLILQISYGDSYPTTPNIQGSNTSGLVATAYFTKL
ncbi:MAG: hypothetical protein V4577_28075 [Bacteroidota bacterium]